MNNTDKENIMAMYGSVGKAQAPRPKGGKTKPKRGTTAIGTRTLERDPNKPRTRVIDNATPTPKRVGPRPRGGVPMPGTGRVKDNGGRGRATGPKEKGNNKMVAPKAKTPGMGGPAGKAKPSTSGTKIFGGTGSVTKNQRMPELQKPGSMRDRSVAPAKPKYTLLPRKITPKRSSKIGR
jgi:hypothetical protein